MAAPASPDDTIAFQGAPGAFSDMACRAVFPAMTTLPCASFEDTFAAVKNGQARLAMIPIDNSLAGRVADIHHLLPESGLHIIGEHFQRVDFQLVAPKGARKDDIAQVHADVAIPIFCIGGIKRENLQSIVDAGARRVVIVSGILQAEDIEAYTRDAKSLLPDL